jgi:hypothetical protein
MTEQHSPITPPHRLVQQWVQERYGALPDYVVTPSESALCLAAQAARWGADHQLKLDTEQINQAWQKGADQELEACCEWLDSQHHSTTWSSRLHTARRPKPPSLKEQALETLRSMQIDPVVINGVNVNADVMVKYDTIRRALEQLPDTL